jgi:hypothetical protein
LTIPSASQKDYEMLVGKSGYYVTIRYNGISKSFALKIKSDGSDVDAGNGVYHLSKTSFSSTG